MASFLKDRTSQRGKRIKEYPPYSYYRVVHPKKEYNKTHGLAFNLSTSFLPSSLCFHGRSLTCRSLIKRSWDRREMETKRNTIKKHMKRRQGGKGSGKQKMRRKRENIIYSVYPMTRQDPEGLKRKIKPSIPIQKSKRKKVKKKLKKRNPKREIPKREINE